MRKKIFIILVFILLLCGCGRKKENVIEDTSYEVRELTEEENTTLLAQII